MRRTTDQVESDTGAQTIGSAEAHAAVRSMVSRLSSRGGPPCYRSFAYAASPGVRRGPASTPCDLDEAATPFPRLPEAPATLAHVIILRGSRASACW